jgi:hypothetical protein
MMLTIIAVTLVPGAACAITNCKIIDLSDHYEAICVGDEKYPLASAPAGASALQQLPAATAGATGQQPKSRGGEASAERSVTQPPAVQQLIAFRQHKLQRSSVEAKQAVRMQMIRAGRQTQAEVPLPQIVGE